jgi:L-alanine-DL-glutamate epimerase-like enolase superfamily enzyme
MKIIDIRCVRFTGTLDKAIGQDEGRPLMPADVDLAFASRPFVKTPWTVLGPDGTCPIRAIFVMVDTDAGITGTSYQIGLPQAQMVLQKLRPWLIGRDPLAIEDLWDLMFRLLSGRNLHGASAVDCALWDIKGKAEGAPVYELLGGPKRDRILPYAGTVGASVDLPKARDLATELKTAGFRAQKWYPPCSEGHGPGGMETNLALVRTLRETVGDEIELMFDAHQGWAVDYAVEMARLMAPYRPCWLEEPVMADDVEGYRAVKQAADFPIAGSEAHQNRWQVQSLLRADAVDVVQPDEYGTGGITEIMRVAQMAADHGKQMAVHCGYMPTLHIVAALPEDLCPYYEYLVNWHEYGEWFYQTKYVAEDGWIRLPEGPGLGMAFDEDRIEKREELDR